MVGLEGDFRVVLIHENMNIDINIHISCELHHDLHHSSWSVH